MTADTPSTGRDKESGAESMTLLLQNLEMYLYPNTPAELIYSARRLAHRLDRVEFSYSESSRSANAIADKNKSLESELSRVRGELEVAKEKLKRTFNLANTLFDDMLEYEHRGYREYIRKICDIIRPTPTPPQGE